MVTESALAGMTMKSISIPVRMVGAGSHVEEEELQYLDMPRDMRTFSMPRVPRDRRRVGADGGARSAGRSAVAAEHAGRPARAATCASICAESNRVCSASRTRCSAMARSASRSTARGGCASRKASSPACGARWNSTATAAWSTTGSRPARLPDIVVEAARNGARAELPLVEIPAGRDEFAGAAARVARAGRKPTSAAIRRT